jgi:TatD DNase family protein
MAVAKLVDTHAHLNDEQYNDDLPEVLKRASQSGVATVVCAGDTVASSRRAVDLARQYQDLYAAVGLHPENVSQANPDYLEELRSLADNKRVVAIGEIGLDYYHDPSSASLQSRVFREQLQLAGEMSLPVLIHDREAHGDIMTILKDYSGLPGVVLHCFSGELSMADACLERGFYLGVGGALTYPRNNSLREIVARVPLNRLLLETDCPYLAPQPWRGKRNEPSYLPVVLQLLAEIKGIAVEEAAAVSTLNARDFFRLSEPAVIDPVDERP